MRRITLLLVLLCGWLTPGQAAEPPTVQTIVILRHGEKPAADLGQLTCQGLNRALALPRVLTERFGRPAAIFAPNPAFQIDFGPSKYDYIRPLATIEPTAITLGLPVDADLGLNNLEGLRLKLESPTLHNAVVFVAWEHILAAKLAGQLLTAHGGDANVVPKWAGTDYDSLLILKITRTADGSQITFEHAQEGLNGLPTACPGPAAG